MKKIGLLCLALVLALGALGVGYAAWTDSIAIEGTVNTGSVDITPMYFSSTYIYKNLDSDAISVYSIGRDATGNQIWASGTVPTNNFLVASAVATPGAGDDAVVFTYTNLFPCQYLTCDVILRYTGSVPVKVNDISWSFLGDGTGDWITPLIASGDIVGYARMGPSGPFGVSWASRPVVEEGTQLHEGDYVKVWLVFHLPQEDALMNRSGSATGTIEVVQWNEYPYIPQ